MTKREKMGRQIVKLRKKVGLSQKDLAKSMNVSFQAISKWERGLSMPDIETLYKLCDVFSISFNYFLFDAFSTMGFEELIKDIDANGITDKNYRSLGALVRSKSLNSDVISMFHDEHIKSCLYHVLMDIDELLLLSDIKLDHRILRVYSDILSLKLDTNEENINGVTLKHTLLKPTYNNMVYQKTLSRLIENTNDEFFFLILENEESVEFKTVCSSNLMIEG